jgi:hypothetical protein
VAAITSGPRKYKWEVKWATMWCPKPDREVHKSARCKLDTRADTICVGENCHVLTLSGQTCDVSRFYQSFGSIKDVPVAQVATANTMENGETVVFVINEALDFGNSMDHSLINPSQIWAFGIQVSNNPYGEIHSFGISHEDCFILFEMEGSTVYFNTFVSSDDQLQSCWHIELTSDEEWDLAMIKMNRHCESARA